MRRHLSVPAVTVALVASLAACSSEPSEPLTVDVSLPTGDCAVVEAVGDLDDKSHLDPADAPPASELYDGPLPSQGPHLAAPLPVQASFDQPIDVRGAVHNLEHGSVIVFYDPDALGADSIAAIEAWATELFDSGFSVPNARAAVMAAPVTEDGVAPVSLRSWGRAVDCDAWSPADADAYVTAYYGSNGDAPEGTFAPFPEDSRLG